MPCNILDMPIMKCACIYKPQKIARHHSLNIRPTIDIVSALIAICPPPLIYTYICQLKIGFAICLNMAESKCLAIYCIYICICYLLSMIKKIICPPTTINVITIYMSIGGSPSIYMLPLFFITNSRHQFVLKHLCQRRHVVYFHVTMSCVGVL